MIFIKFKKFFEVFKMSSKIFKKKIKNIFSKSIIIFIATLIPLKIGDYYLGVSINKKSDRES